MTAFSPGASPPPVEMAMRMGHFPPLSLLDGLEDFSGFGVAPSRLLGEHQRAVHRHLEDSTGGLDQPDLGLRVGLLQLSRQTGGSGLVVSNHAVLDRHLHDRSTLPQMQHANRRES